VGASRLVQVDSVAGADIRLVLGHDLAGKTVKAAVPAPALVAVAKALEKG
jgi:hypothetical protein